MNQVYQEPNAALQARGAAGATQERRLFPVACKRVLGAGLGSDLGCPHRPSGLACGGDDFEILAWHHHRLIA